MTPSKARQIWLYLDAYGLRFAGEPVNDVAVEEQAELKPLKDAEVSD